MWRIADFDPAEGYPSQELLSSRVHPDDRQQLIEANREVIEARRPLNVRYRYFTADGQLRVLHSIATLVGENEGARLAGATRDVTEEAKHT
jgi:PAS domain-containing protein